MSAVEVRRPIIYLCVSAVLALGSLLVTGAGGTTGAGPPSSSPPPPAPQAACEQIRESLRPVGPLPAPGAMPPGSTMAQIAQRGRLIVAVDQGKYLVGYRNPLTGGLEGSDIDIVRLIAAAIFGDPDRVQYIVVPIADRDKVIERRQVDMVVNTYSVTCARQRKVEYSTAYLAGSQRVLVPAGSGVAEIEDLAGQRVCTSRGSTNEEVLRALPVRLEVVTLPSIADCVVELQRGRVAAVSSEDVILAGLAAQDPQVEVVGRELLSSQYAVGMSPQTPDLVRFVNAVLERARADGTLAASNRRWLSVLDPLPPVAPARYRD